MRIFRLLPRLVAIMLSAALAATGHAAADPAPHGASQAEHSTVSVLMLSDIHFDPFHDPAKFAQLQASPADSWPAILDSAASPTQPTEFANIQRACGARGVDTPIALLRDSLRAARAQQPSPLFITVSGDLLAHLFDCRFHILAPKSSAADLSAFAAKTVAFVALQLHQAFPETPIYFALGNNDSGCTDYREDPNSAFLQATAQSFAADAVDPANRAAILDEFPHLGDYSIALPAPMQHARLIVLQDIYASKNYSECNGDTTDAPAKAQIAWLRAQLSAARTAHENVWVMAHIPPGVDPYSTLIHLRNVCTGGQPALFLDSSLLVNTLTDFADIVRLAIFAHTHMDELRLLQSSAGAAVAAKLVPSISPVDGNNPAFTVAAVDPQTAVLDDYTVYAASNQTGSGDEATTWRPEYTYSSTYHLPDVSAASLAKLASGFVADRTGESRASRDYQHFYFVGDTDIGNAVQAAMHIFWPLYACSIAEVHTAGFRACMCKAAPSTLPASQP